MPAAPGRIADEQLQAHVDQTDSEIAARIDSSDAHLRAVYGAPGQTTVHYAPVESGPGLAPRPGFNPYPAAASPSWDGGGHHPVPGGAKSTTIFMQGWLEKHSVSAPSFLKNWKRRYITLLGDRIEWRREMIDVLPAGTLPIAPGSTIAPYPDRPNCISVSTGETTLTLHFYTAVDLNEWAGAIKRAMASAPQRYVSAAQAEVDQMI
jgi:hypothetical protein